jgi:hypothetical protein
MLRDISAPTGTVFNKRKIARVNTNISFFWHLSVSNINKLQLEHWVASMLRGLKWLRYE